MRFGGDAVANEFLLLPGVLGTLSPMKLQKLVYFAHGWHLGLTQDPLLTETVQAWTYGPVVYSVYREFKEYGGDAIPRLARDIRVVGGDAEVYEPRLGDMPDGNYARALVRRIWELYGDYSATQLSKMTHRPGTPWSIVRNKFPGELPRGIDIPDELIRDHFRKRLEANR